MGDPRKPRTHYLMLSLTIQTVALTSVVREDETGGLREAARARQAELLRSPARRGLATRGAQQRRRLEVTSSHRHFTYLPAVPRSEFRFLGT